ncbi:hypothetical protein [Aeribacillus alveayuensis]|uniref:Uncharacterized protein n=1 Tax=Aeribacillus alveayuensis TaxID=279215 RepID=A0ABT9VPX1_9BACI|nr:hypothetical protein [Bacillus alveayuensis]
MNIEQTIEAFSFAQYLHIYFFIVLFLFQSLWQSTNTYFSQTSNLQITLTENLINPIISENSPRIFLFLHYLVQMVKRKEGTDDEDDYVFLL